MAKKSAINPDSIKDLGTVSDRVIAERLGCSITWVSKARKAKGIKPFQPQKRHAVTDPNINWDLVPLGKKTDTQIGKELGVAKYVVRKQRQKRKLLSFSEHRRKRLKSLPTDVLMEKGSTRRLVEEFGYANAKTINALRVAKDPARKAKRIKPETKNKILQDLATTYDKALAKKYGVSATTISNIRRQEKIEAYKLEKRTCLCGTEFRAKEETHIFCSKECRCLANELRRNHGFASNNEINPSIFQMLLSIKQRLIPEIKRTKWGENTEELYDTSVKNLSAKYGINPKSVMHARWKYRKGEGKVQ